MTRVAAHLSVSELEARYETAADAAVTLNVYAYLFVKVDTAAATAIEVALASLTRGGTAGER
jgi:hypothetical protein